MGSDDLFKARRSSRKKRKHEYNNKNAKQRVSMYREGVDKPSTFDLGTTVHELVGYMAI